MNRYYYIVFVLLFSFCHNIKDTKSSPQFSMKDYYINGMGMLKVPYFYKLDYVLLISSNEMESVYFSCDAKKIIDIKENYEVDLNMIDDTLGKFNLEKYEDSVIEEHRKHMVGCEFYEIKNNQKNEFTIIYVCKKSNTKNEYFNEYTAINVQVNDSLNIKLTQRLNVNILLSSGYKKNIDSLITHVNLLFENNRLDYF